MKKTNLTQIVGLFVFSTFVASSVSAMGIRPPRDVKPTPTPAPIATPTPQRPPASDAFKPLWVGRHPDAVNWAGYVEEAVSRHGSALTKGPSDVEDFCPMYHRLGHRDQMNFWIQLMAAMTKFESNFKPTMRYTESTMGTDPVTGKQVVSEGLLQLSYQDERAFASALPEGVCDFDFKSDSKLAINDIRRTIFDPKTNLTCGIWILNRQVERRGKIAVKSGAYWAVIIPGGKYSKLTEIQSITRQLPFCQL